MTTGPAQETDAQEGADSPLRWHWTPAETDPAEWAQFAEEWRRIASKPARYRLLTPLPRRTRLRLWLTGRVDAVSIWLVCHGCSAAADWLWRAARLVRRRR